MSVTKLLFQTPLGAGPVYGVSVAAGQFVVLGKVDVSHYRQIRIVYNCAILSAMGVAFFSSIEDTKQNDLVAILEEPNGMQVAPGISITKVYDVPGTVLSLEVIGNSGTGNAWVQLYIYGHE